eukprot:1150221-Pelagomonas_calceolata.AAC.2
MACRGPWSRQTGNFHGPRPAGAQDLLKHGNLRRACTHSRVDTSQIPRNKGEEEGGQEASPITVC